MLTGLRARKVVVFAAAIVVLLLMLAALCPDSFLRAVPSSSWQADSQAAEAAVVFGFGICRSDVGAPAPGESNRHLLNWTLENTGAPTILVQEGVWAAACSSSAESCEYRGRQLLRMHRDAAGIRVDTLEAAWCAVEKLAPMRPHRIVVVAHHLQLAQAARGLKRVLHERGLNVEVVVPDLPPTPFPGCTDQLQTSSPLFYKPVALLWARPRDLLRRLPNRCPAPCGESCVPLNQRPR